MNQENIGKFISKERKNKELTQKELADKLNISEKTVSKWECGKGLPEVSLMQPLCKELDISVNELLNGAKDPQEDKAIIEYVKYEKKKSKKKIVTLTIVSLLLITFILSTIVYFFNSYNKIAVYELSGESQNFRYYDGILTKSNMYNILNFGMVESKNEEISLDDITGYELKCGNLRIFSRISDTRGMVMNEINIPIMERNGYNDYFSEYKLNNLDKWNLTIHYNYKGDTLTETINIKNNVIMKNNEFVTIKEKSIDKEKTEKEEAAEDKKIGEELESDRKYYTELLKEEGFIPIKDNKYKLKKELNDNEYLIFNTDTFILEYHKVKKEDNLIVIKIPVRSPEDPVYSEKRRCATITGLKKGIEYSYYYYVNTGGYGWYDGGELPTEDKDLEKDVQEFNKHLKTMEKIIYK